MQTVFENSTPPVYPSSFDVEIKLAEESLRIGSGRNSEENVPQDIGLYADRSRTGDRKECRIPRFPHSLASKTTNGTSQLAQAANG